ncbi:MAG: hypothetical protein OER85_08170 [Gammaproteobacteria bacterium]|nr:hypothetical protein [Gammaproteobacteria bacterium]
MAFAYYKRLSRRQQAIYRQSAAIEHVRLTDAHAFFPLTDELATAMAGEDQKVISRISSELIAELCRSLKAPTARIRVLAKRPSDDWGELHGLYEPVDRNQTARMTVWMRTAQKKKVVAFRTFLRTLLHELCHHLDYELFSLEESFHTEGFYKRESSLFHQIVRDAAKKTE